MQIPLNCHGTGANPAQPLWTRRLRASAASDTGVLILLSLAWLLFHVLTNGQYGFHRDELAFLDEGRHLAWGYVEYPPLAPLLARVAWQLAGASLIGLTRFRRALDEHRPGTCRADRGELGGGRWAQVIAALAVATAPIVLSNASMFSYESFDYLWWVLAVHLLVRLLRSENPRYWLSIGATIGLGMMTKYTIAFLVAGMAAGICLTPARRYLRGPWLWGGAGLGLRSSCPT